MTGEQMDPKVIEVAYIAFKSYGATINGTRGRLEAAIRAADRERGLKEEIRRCGCEDGRIERGPAGATYSMPHERCGGSGWLIRLVGSERPYWRQKVERGGEDD